MFPNRAPMNRDTPSLEPLVYVFIHSFIRVCLPESQERSPPACGGKHNVTVHRAPRRRKAYLQWRAVWFPKEIVIKDTAVSTPVPCSLWHDTFHLGLGRPERRLAACVVATPIRSYPPHLLPPPT